MSEITNEPLLPIDLTLEKFKAAFMEHGPVPSLARYYGVSPAQIFTTAIKYNLSLRKLNSERVRYKAKKAYEAIAKKLGHYPTSREIRQDKESKKLYGAIRRLFGTLNRFREAYGYPSPPDTSIARAEALYKDYLKFGTLTKVAKKYNITSWTVGQILRNANAKGLFKYPPEKPDLLSYITPKQLKADYIFYGPISNLAIHYGVAPGAVNRLARKYNLSIRKMVTERAKKRLFEDYKEILTNLGHRPTTTEIQRLLKSLYSRILHHYKSIDNFRKIYRYPKPTGKYSKKI